MTIITSQTTPDAPAIPSKPGFKHTKAGSIPSEWEVVRLEDITASARKIGYGVVQTGPSIEGGIPCLRVVDMNGQKIDVKNLITTSKKIDHSYKRTRLQIGDVVIALRGKIGQVLVVNTNLEGCNLTRGVALIPPNHSKIDPNFLSYYLSSPKGKLNFERRMSGSALQEISIKVLRRFPVPLPPLPEQQRIATLLTTWDRAITTTQALIKQLEARKRGLMQRLLTGEVRLPGFDEEWRTEKLGKYFAERNERDFSDLQLLSLGRDGVYPQDLSNKKDTSNSDKSKYKRICRGDIGYNTMRMWQGRSALSTMEGIVSPAYTILKAKKDADPEFFIGLFHTQSLIHKFYRYSQGLVSDTWQCKFKDFTQVRTAIPPTIQEQTAIANILKSADNEIKIHRRRLKQLQVQKRGLMQQLLTGQKRLLA